MDSQDVLTEALWRRAIRRVSPGYNQQFVGTISQDEWKVVVAQMRERWNTITTSQKARLVKTIVDDFAVFNRHQLAKKLGFDKNVVWWLYDLASLPADTLDQLDCGTITRKEALQMAQHMRKNPQPVERIMDQAEDLECPAETQAHPCQILPNFIADRVLSPVSPFISQAEASLRRFKEGRATPDYNESLPSFDRAYESYREWLGISDPPRLPFQFTPPSAKAKRIVVVNDIHDPFKDEEAFKEFLRRERGKADLCILAGDGCDMWSWSRWPKGTYRCSPKEELLAHKKTLHALAETFSDTVVIPGNHVDRAVKYMQGKGLPPEMMDYLNFCAPAALSPYAFLLADIPNIKMASPMKNGDAKYSFLYQIGDLVIGHPEVFSIIPNRAVSTFIHWLQSFALPMGLVQDFKVAGIGHTHQAGKTFADYGVVGFEMGCMQTLPDYSADPKLRGAKRPPVIGYTVFIQEDGVTNVEESNFIPLRFGRSFIN
jgi:hypothetical protein